MKTYIITAVLSVMTLGHIAEAQDGKSIRTKTKIAEEMLASLPDEDINVATPTPIFTVSAKDMSLLVTLPTTDVNVEMPTLINEKEVVAKTAPKVEVKAATDTRRVGDK